MKVILRGYTQKDSRVKEIHMKKIHVTRREHTHGGDIYMEGHIHGRTYRERDIYTEENTHGGKYTWKGVHVHTAGIHTEGHTHEEDRNDTDGTSTRRDIYKGRYTQGEIYIRREIHPLL